MLAPPISRILARVLFTVNSGIVLYVLHILMEVFYHVSYMCHLLIPLHYNVDSQHMCFQLARPQIALAWN